jgi:hypothetical protein
MHIETIGWMGALLSLTAAALRWSRPQAVAAVRVFALLASVLLMLYAWQKDTKPLVVLFLALALMSLMRLRPRPASVWGARSPGISFKLTR